jgi:hypothetical protein
LRPRTVTLPKSSVRARETSARSVAERRPPSAAVTRALTTSPSRKGLRSGGVMNAEACSGPSIARKPKPRGWTVTRPRTGEDMAPLYRIRRSEIGALEGCRGGSRECGRARATGRRGRLHRRGVRRRWGRTSAAPPRSAGEDGARGIRSLQVTSGHFAKKTPLRSSVAEMAEVLLGFWRQWSRRRVRVTS